MIARLCLRKLFRMAVGMWSVVGVLACDRLDRVSARGAPGATASLAPGVTSKPNDASSGSNVAEQPDRVLVGDIRDLGVITNALYIAVDDTFVYVSTQDPDTLVGAIYKLPKAGGQPTTIAEPVRQIRALTTSLGQGPFWASGTWVQPSEVQRPGPKGRAPLTIVVGAGYDAQFAVDGKALYYFEARSDAKAGAIRKKVLGQNGTESLATTSSATNRMWFDGESLYWRELTSDMDRIIRLSRDGKSRTTFDVDARGSLELAADRKDVFITERARTGTRISRFPKTGGERSTFVTQANVVTEMRTDERHLYWIDGTERGSTIRRKPKDGGEIETVARSQTIIRDIRLDSRFLYWLDQDHIFQMAKP